MKYTKAFKKVVEGQLIQVMRDNSIKEGNPFYFMIGKIRFPYCCGDDQK